jgi:hypothetical protein
VLRRLARLFDDRVTEPHVRRYYEWLLQHGKDDEKGDFVIDARGSSALVERDIQNQSVVQMGNIVLNPAFGIDPKKWFGEYCKSQRLDPKAFQYSPEDQKRIEEQQANGPTDPRVAVAQLRAQVETQLAKMEQQYQSQENERDRQKDIFIAEIDNASKESVTEADLRTRLAEMTMKLRTQRDLSAQSTVLNLHKHAVPQAVAPPTEPKGKAPAGQAFAR